MHIESWGPLPLHRLAVLASIGVVNAVQQADLSRTTPCEGWNLVDLLAHMTAQHRGFAAAARGFGADLAFWRPEAVLASVTADPAGTYADAAHDVLDAFAADGAADMRFALPDFGADIEVAGSTAMGFHFVDYVVHGWDVAATLGVPYRLPEEVVAAALPLALSVPDGDSRTAPDAPFGSAVESTTTDDLERILNHLGRRSDWNQAYSTVTGA